MTSLLPPVLRGLACAVALACALPASHAQAQAQGQAPAAAALPPIASFFSSSRFGGAKLSPDARFLAARSSAPGKRDFLVVVDLQANSAKVVASYNDADIGQFQWISNERLLFDTLCARPVRGQP